MRSLTTFAKMNRGASLATVILATLHQIQSAGHDRWSKSKINFREKEKEILDGILGSDRYDSRIRPAPSQELNDTRGGGATVVHVNTYIRSIDNIDDKAMEYSVQITFREDWVDPRLVYSDYNGRLKYLTMTDPNKVWMPDTFFANEKHGHFHNIIVPNVYIRIFPNGKVLYSIRISLALACPMNLKLYPLDRQECEMKIASYGWTTDDLIYKWKEKEPVQLVKDLNLPRFKLERFSTTYCNSKTNTGEYSCLKVGLVFKREFSYYLLTIYVPSCMLVIVSWVSFWLDSRSVPARVALGVTTLLTMSTQTSGVNRSLPPVAYTKAIDVWSGACVVFVFSALLEFAFVNYASRSDRRKGRVRRGENPLMQGSSFYDPDDMLEDYDPPVQEPPPALPKVWKNAAGELVIYPSDMAPPVCQVHLTLNHKPSSRSSCSSHSSRRYKKFCPCTFLSKKFPLRSKRIDVLARIIFPIVFATFNLCYWIFYLSAERNTMKNYEA